MSIFKKIELYHEKTIFWDIMGKLNRLVRNKHRRPLVGVAECESHSVGKLRCGGVVVCGSPGVGELHSGGIAFCEGHGGYQTLIHYVF